MLPYLICIDPSLSRLDYSLLSDQARIEMFFGDCNPALKHKVGIIHKKSRPTEFVDVCEWAHAKCDEDGNVIRIDLCYKTSRGPSTHEINFTYIPPNVKRFYMKHIRCAREIILSDLPEAIEVFSVLKSTLPCTFQSHHLPRGLARFIVGWNNFEGSCDLTVLPPNLVELSMNDNALSGEISLDHLPETLITLDLTNNFLQGPIALENLPDSIQWIDLSKNKFGGPCVITSIPDSLRQIRLFKNELKGTAVLLKGVNGYQCSVNLYGNFLSGLVDEEGEKHRWEAHVLDEQE